MKKQLLQIHPDRLTLGGEDFYLASGDFHYFRTLEGGWRHRLRLMKSFGLTAVQTYVPWHLHEPEKGDFRFDGYLNLRRFIELCGEEGLYVMLRPSPYICSECDFGGLPYWLLNEDCTVRTSDEGFMKHVRSYLTRLAEEFVPLLSTRGGPIIAVALENEYGSYGMDLDYLRATLELYSELGIDVPIYTAGGPDMYKQKFGGFPEVWSGIDLRNGVPGAIRELRQFQTGFVPYVAEMWGGCAQQWGGVFPRQKPETVEANYREALEAGAMVNFYMFCGGTSFGFTSGALHATFRADVRGALDRYIPFTTSYDTDAPVSEDGRVTEKFLRCRKVLADYRGIPLESLPPVPDAPETQLAGEITWERSVSLYESLGELAAKVVKSGGVLTMEKLGQAYGYINYRAKILRTDPDSSYILHIDGLHDRADIYLDGEYRATYYRDRPVEPLEFRVEGEYVTLDILVENMGRINYGYKMLSDRKGILECVRLGVRYDSGAMMYNRAIVTGFEISSLPMDSARVARALDSARGFSEASGARLFRGRFSARPGVDTFLDFARKKPSKGFVLINGFNIGRYFAVGPQDTLYVPGELLRESNVIEVFEQYSCDAGLPELAFVGAHRLDSISQNAELVLAARA